MREAGQGNSPPQPPRLRLLGTAEFEPGAGPAQRFLPERRFRLLAHLAIRGDWISRDELANLFWPDRSQEAARSNLRKLLLEVRALDVPLLEADRSGLRWKVSTDVAEFQAALKRGDAKAAFALYRGPPLPGLDGGDSATFSTWLANERVRLHAAWHDAVVAEFPHRDPAEVLELAQRLLADDPCDEDAIVAALDALGARGDGPAAADAFRSYAERLIEDLGVEPSARVRTAAARATGPAQPGATPPRRRSTDASASPATPASAAAALPAERFIGRMQELEELSVLLTNPDCRLLTVTGPGGVGKSRLVKQVVRQVEAKYADGAIWIGLDDLTELAQVAPRMASALGIELVPRQDPVDRVAAHLAQRQVLLVLDNSEHLPRLSTLVERLLAAGPRLQVLTTSRTRIGLAHEWLVPLTGLTLPPADGSASDVAAADAVQLFVAQARATDPRFNIDANTAHVATLVRAVGGLPLAILLAASWIRLVPMSELAQEVTQSLDVLERAEEGDERPEHRSVRATFEQSWRLLVPAEQRALAALSVTAGGFSRSAARDVAQAPLPLLAALLDKSLVQVDAGGRFSLHPLVHQFAAEKLGADADAASAARAAHRRHFEQWLTRTTDVPRAEEPQAYRLIEAELENLRAMWRHAVKATACDTIAAAAVPLMRFFELRSRWNEGRQLLDDAADALLSHAAGDRVADFARANVWRAQATLDFRAGLHARCIERAQRSLAICRQLGIRTGIKGNLNCLGLATWQLARRDEAAAYFAAAIDEARADGDSEGEAIYLGNSALVAKAQGDYQEALRCSEAALTVHRARDNKVSIQTTLNNLGNLHRALQQPRKAIEALTEALALPKQQTRNSTHVFVMCNLALAYSDLGEHAQALAHAEASLTLLRTQGEPALEASIHQALARALSGLGRFVEARDHLARALQLSLAERRFAVAVGTLMHWGHMLSVQGELAQGLGVLTFAAKHEAIDGPDRDFALRTSAAIESRLGPERAEPAKLAATVMSLEHLAALLMSGSDTTPRRAAQ